MITKIEAQKSEDSDSSNKTFRTDKTIGNLSDFGLVSDESVKSESSRTFSSSGNRSCKDKQPKVSRLLDSPMLVKGHLVQAANVFSGDTDSLTSDSIDDEKRKRLPMVNQRLQLVNNRLIEQKHLIIEQMEQSMKNGQTGHDKEEENDDDDDSDDDDHDFYDNQICGLCNLYESNSVTGGGQASDTVSLVTETFENGGSDLQWNELDQDVFQLMQVLQRLTQILEEKERQLAAKCNLTDRASVRKRLRELRQRVGGVGLAICKSLNGNRLIILRDGKCTYHIEGEFVLAFFVTFVFCQRFHANTVVRTCFRMVCDS